MSANRKFVQFLAINYHHRFTNGLHILSELMKKPRNIPTVDAHICTRGKHIKAQKDSVSDSTRFLKAQNIA